MSKLATWALTHLTEQHVPNIPHETAAFAYLKTRSFKELYGFVIAAKAQGFRQTDITWYLGLKEASVRHILSKYKP